MLDNVLTNDLIPSISLDLLKSKYLYVLTEDMTEDEYNAWIDDVAISPFSKVNVYNGDHLVFYIPPMRYTPPLSDENVSNIIDQYSLRAERLPVEGERFMEAYVKPLVQPSEPPPEDIHEWRKVLDYFGIKKMPLEQGSDLNETLEEYTDPW